MYYAQSLGLTSLRAVFTFELEKQKTFKPGQLYVALGRIKNLQGLYLTGSFQPKAIKANVQVTHEYERLRNEALFFPQVISTITPTNLMLTLLNTRFLRRHAIDIVSDSQFTIEAK